jgi:hypothetical protein
MLKTHLSAHQRQQYEAFAYFDVIGGSTGMRYRIHHGKQNNVQVFDSRGVWVKSLCFVPRGQLPVGDIMLAQKVGIELFEPEVLRVAVSF